MELTITEAAKLYGKQRKTLYRHIASGRLSCTSRGDGHRVINLSELIRCYGEANGSTSSSDTPVTHEEPQGDTAVSQAMLDELRALRCEVAELKEAMLALPAPDQSAPQPDGAELPASVSSTAVTADTPPHDLGDVLARFEARTHTH